MVLQVGVKVLLKNSQGKYLLVRRNPKKYPEVGPKWDIVGGRINPGFILMENLKREVKEETGLELSIEPKLAAAQDIFVRRYADDADLNKELSEEKIERHVVRLTYIGEIEGEPNNLGDDHLEVKWFTAQEIKAMDVNILDSYFKELVDRGVVVL